MTYKIEFTKGAVKELKKLPPDIRERIELKIQDLAVNPRPDGVKKLQSELSLYRIRVGDYRVIYQIQDDILLVTIVKAKHRREIYRQQ
ncbi:MULTISPECIES: type II toxin-antitoxin system RelE family toxin [Cyanophyceae]|uniref:type II toxin-antitoxin system RelE family toxin n=1 Tax=Cyanophyceae TaxID=3028117 RepID=UPI00232EC411|nr:MULTISPECIES: type II toxin-antitoxin system RelE/ParE family toxin [Cyanophyceae]MDB9358213.1 type II toxin-antitoxin system RelE/ParE family toxin [Nodularia spumigena CS-587/03]MDB9316113.1 type II toxin-antitoxin system RelE/ParE family toxin [Nodularia spumigena CS-590/01A]MDB9322005.1 type II toxin-antitoxin system RelE/ParE family toxin [Nodularia spumigena CS-591/07A]MDB9325431.1 type II toxin-antitoxin system RelE/ParE family toxin [Nodularia spumigena CS-590/02]MDB9331466.1 type I